MAAMKKVRSPNSHARINNNDCKKAGTKPVDDDIAACKDKGRKRNKPSICSAASEGKLCTIGAATDGIK